MWAEKAFDFISMCCIDIFMKGKIKKANLPEGGDNY